MENQTEYKKKNKSYELWQCRSKDKAERNEDIGEGWRGRQLYTVKGVRDAIKKRWKSLVLLQYTYQK